MKHCCLLLFCLCELVGAVSQSWGQVESQAISGSDRPQRKKGYPSRAADLDVLSGFQHPPKGYGNVPFYWWSGDHLSKERLEAQLDQLSASATDGFAVSYIHTDPRTDSLFNKGGYGLYGKTEPGEPAVFSDEWWDIWKWFSGECAKRGLGVGLDDYTVGWIGNGYYPDELDKQDTFRHYKGELEINAVSVRQHEFFEYELPANYVTAIAWPGKVVLDDFVRQGKIKWRANEDVKVYVVTAKDSYILHPDYGKALVDVYFNRFENKMTEEERAGMNYFFQDELSYPIRMLSWSEDFQTEFQKRKGYDIMPYLPALKEYIGPVTPKIRLDYTEVLMDLSEERYYKPVYDWHADRGLIYGCDNLGRGVDPLAYIDYFRAISWYTAPGNDAPSQGSSFLQTKISSSITHLYNRPRTWLEAFHSMGWGSSGEWLTRQIDHHFIAGGNLVCMHGLYYSTHGGWWEWAPPCFHFRMPYWEHMKTWLAYTERMSYLLSQGDHVCDIALMYPTESMQAYPDATADTAFNVARNLSQKGLDYDFIDFRSLRESRMEKGELQITNEKYKVLVVAGMRAMHHSSLLKMRDFYRSGGIVLATGGLPVASSREGEQDPEVEAIMKEVFGMTAADVASNRKGVKQTNGANGVGWYIANGRVEDYIPDLITPDFVPNENGGKVLHRKIGNRDVYMVMNVDKGSECFFRSTGNVELWNAQDGSVRPCPVIRQDERGTWLHMNKEYTNSYLVVFSPGKPEMEKREEKGAQSSFQIQFDGEWEVDLVPTLNNKWGDFRLPVKDEWIKVEARAFRCMPGKESPSDWMKSDFDDHAWTEDIYGYGAQAETYADSLPVWQPVSFSWEYGIWDQPGSQGYHGLKSKVSDGFFVLSGGGKQLFRTYVYAPEAGTYRIEQAHTPAAAVRLDGKSVEGKVFMTNGWHSLQVEYDGTPRMDYRSQTGGFRDFRPRGAVVFLPEQAPAPVKPSIYADEVAMCWTHSDHLYFDPYQGRYPVWNYRFRSVPGLEAMLFAVRGTELNVWIDGEKLPDTAICPVGTERPDGINYYQVECLKKQKRAGVVAFSVKAQTGWQGAAVLAEPIKLQTGTGLMTAGDWAETGALRYYSGGMRYTQMFRSPIPVKGQKAWLDLGDIVATCEVRINGTSAGILMSPPYQVEIGSYLQEGTNRIEVLVYSTLANHYQTIPTPYRGSPRAGLIGPVRLSFFDL